MDLDNKIDRAEENLQRELDWIGRHDTRIAFAAGVLLAMLGILANASASISIWNWYTYVSFVSAAALLFISLILIYMSQYPKTKSMNSSLIFFGTISALKCDDFKKKFMEMKKEDYLDDLLCQIHINSEILTKKFDYLKYSLLLLGVALIPWLGAMYISQMYFK